MAGSRGISRACKSVGFFTRSWEISDSELEDCLHKDVYQCLLSAASHHCLALCWLGLVCTSWSRARRNRSGKKGWPAPIRDREHLLGLPDLPPNDLRKVLEGNRQARWAARLFDALSRLGVPCVIENPASSMLWDLPQYKQLLAKYNSVQVDYCAFGTPYRKRTTLLFSHLPLGELAGARCAGRGGHCSFSGRPHTELAGRTPDNRQLWSQVASAYPPQFCLHIAQVLSRFTPPHPPRT